MKGFQTERLVLRPFTMDDVQDLHREIYADEEVVRFYSGRGVQTRMEVRRRVRDHLAVWRDEELGRHAVCIAATGEFIGQIHLDCYVNSYARWRDEPDPPYNSLEVELAFAFGRRFWGYGYAFEACTAAIRYAFGDLRLRRLVGAVHHDNERSLALHRRLGYRIEPNVVPGDDGYVAILDAP